MDGLSELVGQLDSCYPVDHASVELAHAPITTPPPNTHTHFIMIPAILV